MDLSVVIIVLALMFMVGVVLVAVVTDLLSLPLGVEVLAAVLTADAGVFPSVGAACFMAVHPVYHYGLARLTTVVSSHFLPLGLGTRSV